MSKSLDRVYFAYETLHGMEKSDQGRIEEDC